MANRPGISSNVYFILFIYLELFSGLDNEDFQSGAKETCRGRMWCLVGHCAAEKEGKTGL